MESSWGNSNENIELFIKDVKVCYVTNIVHKPRLSPLKAETKEEWK